MSRQASLLLRIAGFIAVYLAASAFAIRFNGPSQIALYWPASGFAFAVVVVAGWRWALLVPVALVLKMLWFEPVPAGFLAFSIVGNLGGLLAGGWFARRESPLRPGSVRYAIKMMAGGMLMALVGGIVGGYGMWFMDRTQDLASAQLLWALGDFLGIASVAPALMIGAARWRRRQLRSSQPELAGERSLWNIALVASYLLMAWGMGASGAFPLGLTTLPLAAMVWSAVRFTPMRTAVSVMLTVALIAALASSGIAGFPRPTGTLETTILLGYLCLLAILPQALALSVDEHRVLNRSLQRRARTDALSGLPNRGEFEAQARKALEDPANASLALAYLDLDNLKLVNDTASHRAGDALIVAVAEALRIQLHADDLLGHLGGDEFVVLMRNASATAARERSLGLLRAVEAARCRYAGEEFGTTASVGLVPFQPGQVDFAEILSQADAACFAAKELGGDRIRMAAIGSNALADPVSGMRWTVRIREALQDDGFLLYAQSIVPLQPGLEPGARFELLLRMRDEHGGPPHTPDTFIAAAERFRLAVRIDRHVVRMALAQLEAQPEAAAAVALCTINLSAGALLDEGFVDFVADRLHYCRFPAGRLCFEITETSAMRDPARAQRVIDDLRSVGCRFALDDFGTGFCSYGHLRALDVDFIKIDGSFVQDMVDSPLSAEVVGSITRIAHLLRKRTIAEHTETEAVRDALAAIGVDFAQGYAIDHPQPLKGYLAALARQPLHS